MPSASAVPEPKAPCGQGGFALLPARSPSAVSFRAPEGRGISVWTSRRPFVTPHCTHEVPAAKRSGSECKCARVPAPCPPHCGRSVAKMRARLARCRRTAPGTTGRVGHPFRRLESHVAKSAGFPPAARARGNDRKTLPNRHARAFLSGIHITNRESCWQAAGFPPTARGNDGKTQQPIRLREHCTRRRRVSVVHPLPSFTNCSLTRAIDP